MPPGRNGPYRDEATPVRNTAHWLGLFNMAGNVAEWTASPYLPYETVNGVRPRDDPDYTRKRRVIRGGSFTQNRLVSGCRTAVRYHGFMRVQMDDVGFRCAKSAN